MSSSTFERENGVRYGRILKKETGKELWVCLSSDDKPDVVMEEKCVTYHQGNVNVVLSVPHAGTLGIDIEGCLRDVSGDILETRIGTVDHPISTYSGDAGTDTIAKKIKAQLSNIGLKPHIIECHLHRSKVECNRSLGQIAVAKRDGPAEHIYKTYHGWVEDALERGRQDDAVVLMIDVHGHGHPHGYVELGYGLACETLNQIDNEKLGNVTWKKVINSKKGANFTMRNLIEGKRSSNRIAERIVGSQSFSAFLAQAASKIPGLEGIKILPSSNRPSPGRLGYFSGGFTVQHHSKADKVDAFQMELPVGARTGDGARMTAVGQCLAEAIEKFRQTYYTNDRKDREWDGEDMSSEEDEAVDCDAEVVVTAPAAPGPPTPPPPPSPSLGIKDTKSDAISHGTSLAKSRMHQELMRVAQKRAKDQSIK